MGPPGPPGAAGAPGANLTAIAGVAIGGHRAVIIENTGLAGYASNTTLSHIGRLAGITTSASVIGDSITILSLGPVTEPSWNWTPNAPVYLGTAGLLTQTQPITGFLQIIGVASTATTLFINPREPLVII